MGMTGAEYLTQMQALLPRGAVWPRAADANLTKLLSALAEEFARVDASAEALGIDAIPASTSDLLSDWERVAGLPDPCVGQLESTLQGRRNALVAKLSASGSASTALFISVAESLGYSIQIREFRQFVVGSSSVGDALCGSPWLYTWEVVGPSVTVTRFRTGESAVGERLADFGDALFECVFNALKPAHTRLLFRYVGHLVNEDGLALVDEFGNTLALEAA